MPRVLILGQGVKPTGYGRVSASLLPRLAHFYEMHLFAINYRGPKLEGEWTVHPNLLLGDNRGVDQLPALLDSLRPDVVLIIHDWWLFLDHAPALAAAASRPKVILYCPIDGVTLDPCVPQGVRSVDRLVLFTQFARGVVEEGFANCGEDRFAPPPIEVIPHGVDRETFHPLCAETTRARRAKAREAVFSAAGAGDDQFIVLNANRNVPRKRVDISIEAFALFASGKPDARLCLHMGLKDLAYDIEVLTRRLGVADKVIFAAPSERHPEVSDGTLNLLYNACDVGLNTCSGEGWGLVAFEHAATGAAQIMPRHSVCQELWKGSALLVEPTSWFRHPQDVVEHALVRAEDVAAALEELYRDRSALQCLADAALANASAPELDWDNIARRWRRLIDETIACDVAA